MQMNTLINYPKPLQSILLLKIWRIIIIIIVVINIPVFFFLATDSILWTMEGLKLDLKKFKCRVLEFLKKQLFLLKLYL